MGLLSLFVVALIPVVKTLLITGVGLMLALDRVNILNDSGRQSLNNLTFYVFTPALVGANLAETITSSNIAALWFMPVNVLLTFLIGSALGWILVKVTRTAKQYHALVIGCCASGNMGNLLLIIIPAVCAEKNSPFGDSTTCSSNGLAYASLSMAICAVYIWTYVYNIIRAYGSNRSSHISSSISIDCSGIHPEMFAQSSTEPLVPAAYPTSEQDYEAPPEQALSRYEDKINASEDKTKVPLLKKMGQHAKIFMEKINLQMWLTPSTIATIVGLTIGIANPLRSVLIGSGAPLRVIESSSLMLGAAAVPSMTLIVGANLLRGLKRSGVGVWLVIGVVLVRNILLPLVGVGVVKAANHFGMVGSNNALYQFVLMLQYAVPPAMALGTITQLFEIGERECSVIMLWTYAVAAISLTLWSTFYLWLVS